MTAPATDVQLRDLYGPGKFCLSYELFPPKTDKGMASLRTNLEDLLTFEPTFITCTYGAGGSTRDRTLDTLAEVRKMCDLPLASHLTAVGATADDLRDYLKEAERRGINFIVAIRGDPPKGETEFKPTPGGFSYGNELVSFIRSEFPRFGIAVGGYPETHQEAPNPDTDLDNLKRKVEAGADAVITQLFYDNEDFFRWRDRCEKMGIDVPIVPGILPITSLQQIQRIAAMCGASMPKTLIERLEAHGDDPVGQLDVGVYHATSQVEELVDNGIPGIHFYVLNKSEATSHVLRALSLPPKTPA